MSIKSKLIILILLVAAIIFFNSSSRIKSPSGFSLNEPYLSSPFSYFEQSSGETECLPDCSKRYDLVPVCHADCHGINGCSFYDNIAIQACTSSGPRPIDAAAGNVESYNDTHKIKCCEGRPYMERYKLIMVAGRERNFIRTTRIVFFRGKIARMVITAFS